MSIVRVNILPRRLTQIYTDTKKSYEHVVRTNENWTNPQLSTTYLKLRIQKDRLVAWGIEWADSSASQAGDIDGSLDRAGVGELVESIMKSINTLLDEAEKLRPQRALQLPGSFADEKYVSFEKQAEQSNRDLARLDDVVRDLTTSIDTLCDLSRSQQALRRGPLSPEHKRSENITEKVGDWASKSQSSELSGSKNKPSASFLRAGPWSRIELSRLRIPPDTNTPGPSPPSYQTVAASADDRVLAFFRHTTESQETVELPVVLEYSAPENVASADGGPPRRFDELLEILQASPLPDDVSCPSTLRLLGWFEDPNRARYGLVYEVPGYSLNHPQKALPTGLDSSSGQPQSLLSFLQHGADADSRHMPSLEDRFRLAFNLASSVLYLHTKGITHRDINSNNVLFFPDKQIATSTSGNMWEGGVVREPFLASFDQGADDIPDSQEEPFISSIYRHPRTVRGLRSSFRPSYEIYSLGLILLEIGLWVPLSKLWKTRYTRPDFKQRQQTIFAKRLAGKCSTMYMRVVESCLRAGDEHLPSRRQSDRTVHSESQQQPQTDLYWDVVRPLEECCRIDIFHVPERAPEAAALGGVKPGSREELVHSPDVDPTASMESLRGLRSPSEPTPQPPRLNIRRKPLPEPDTTPSSQPKSTKCKVWSHEIPIAHSTYWNATMCPKLDRILRKVIDRWESYSIDLFMSGETQAEARPTIYMMCDSVDRARKALQHLNKEKGFFDIKVVKGQISRSKAGKRRRPTRKNKKQNSPSGESSNCPGVQNQHYQQRPACGASIGAYKDNHHLPPVTFGGAVLVDGESYGMSVHHMLENDDIDYGLDQTVDLQRSMALPAEESEVETVVHESLGHADLPEALYPFEVVDEDEGYQSSEGDPDAWISEIIEAADSEYPEDDQNEIDMGDTDGIVPGSCKGLLVTQPAIDDVDEGFFPNEEDMDDEHISSHSFGHVHASSGIKRRRRGNISHEVDWALIKIRQQRERPTNIVSGGAQHCTRKPPLRAADHDDNASYPCQVATAEELGGLNVHALGRTSGLQAGRILPAMSIIKMPGRISSSQSWTVMGNFGAGGDSGAWVIDNATNRVCAHVLAFSERNNTAYIAPMDLVLDDISRTLKVSVTLPPYPPVNEEKPAIAVNTTTGYSPPDTPPPSPPVATSPQPPYVAMENLGLVYIQPEKKIPGPNILRETGNSRRRSPPPKTVSKDVGVSGEGSTALKRRSGGIQAKG